MDAAPSLLRRVRLAGAGLALVWLAGVALSRCGTPSTGDTASRVDTWMWSWARGTAPRAVLDAMCRPGDARSVVALSVLTAALVTLGGVLSKRPWSTVLAAAVAVPVAVGAAGVFTQGVAKPLLGRHIGAGLVDAYPSGHATGSAALAAAVLCVLPRRWKPAGALLLVVPASAGWGMLATGSHYPTDVLAGWVVGAAFGATVPAVLVALARYRRQAPDDAGTPAGAPAATAWAPVEAAAVPCAEVLPASTGTAAG